MVEPAPPTAGGVQDAPADGVPTSSSPVVPLPPERRTVEDAAGAVAMALLALITFLNVLVRYLTDESFAWSEEISVSLMVILTLVAGSAAVFRDRHIRIELFFDAGSAARRRRYALFSALATTVAFLILTSLSCRLAWDDYRYDVTSPGIGVPQWWYTIWLPVLAALVAFRGMQRFVRLWLSR